LAGISSLHQLQTGRNIARLDIWLMIVNQEISMVRIARVPETSLYDAARQIVHSSADSTFLGSL
jgi:hypothetical protein